MDQPVRAARLAGVMAIFTLGSVLSPVHAQVKEESVVRVSANCPGNITSKIIRCGQYVGYYQVVERDTVKITRDTSYVSTSVPIVPGAPVGPIRIVTVDTTKTKAVSYRPVSGRDIGMVSVIPSPDSANVLLLNRYITGDSLSTDAGYILRIWGDRTFVRFRELGAQVYPLVIPLRVRPGYTETVASEEIDVPEIANGSVSIGVYGALFARERYYRYERGRSAVVQGSGRQVSFGPLLGFSVLEVNDANTLADGDTTTVKRSLGTVSFGGGLTLGNAQLNLGLFGGWEWGFTDGAERWDYQGRPWWGVGVVASPSLVFK